MAKVTLIALDDAEATKALLEVTPNLSYVRDQAFFGLTPGKNYTVDEGAFTYDNGGFFVWVSMVGGTKNLRLDRFKKTRAVRKVMANLRQQSLRVI